MKCLYPQEKKVVNRHTTYTINHRCGQCKACRITRREEVGARIFLESLMYRDKAAFVTLTYDSENMPENGSLVKKDVRRFGQNLRRLVPDHEVSTVLVGEYGDESQRAHYHLAIYGIPLNVAYDEKMPKYRQKYRQVCKKRHHRPVDFPGYEKLCLRAWKYRGHASIGLIEVASAKYIGGYATKKLTANKSEPEGCIPEFVTWSRKKAVGKVAAQYIADSLLSRKCYPMEYPNMARGPDWIPVNWQGMAQVEGKTLVLDRYMKNRVIEAMGGDFRDEDRKRMRNFMRSVAERQRPVLKHENRNRPIIDIRLSEKEKAQQKAYLYLSKKRRAARQKRSI